MTIRVCVGILMMMFGVLFYIWGTFFAYYERKDFLENGPSKSIIDKFFCKLDRVLEHSSYMVDVGKGKFALWSVTILSLAFCLCFSGYKSIEQFINLGDYMFIFVGIGVLLRLGLLTLSLTSISSIYLWEGARLALPGLMEKVDQFMNKNTWTMLAAIVLFIAFVLLSKGLHQE